MSRMLLQFDVPLIGPRGAKMTRALGGLARTVADKPGFGRKIRTANQAEGRAGGNDLFETALDAEAYRRKHAARLESLGATGIRAIAFGVNEGLSLIARGPI